MSHDEHPDGERSLSPYLEAVRELFDRQSDLVQQNRTVAVFIAGGAAVHWWTRERVTGDVDAEFGSRFVPDDTTVRYMDNGIARVVYLDRNFNPMMACCTRTTREMPCRSAMRSVARGVSTSASSRRLTWRSASWRAGSRRTEAMYAHWLNGL